MKHTPGPWEVRQFGEYNLVFVLVSNDTIRKERYGEPIAKTLGLDKLSNARLIAESPALYKAGKQIVEMWEKGDLAEAVSQLDTILKRIDKAVCGS